MVLKYLDAKSVAEILPERTTDMHKGDCGRVLLLCGSLGYTGAPALAARAALRTGSGLVYLAVPESIYVIEATKLDEVIVLPLTDDAGCISEQAKNDICKLLVHKDAVLIGCGSGKTDGVFQMVKTVLQQFEGTVILDADGINVLRQHKDVLRERTGPTILTPHEGEFARFTDSVSGDRVRDAASLASELGVIVLLKGHNTIVTDGTTVYINKTGNPGMAVGGCGDMLAGMIVSLVGQGVPPLDAAACAAWLHGAAGDLSTEMLGQRSMLPSDMLDVLPRLLK